jgi:hypothetical protein
VITILLYLADGTQILNVYNVYNLLSTSHNDEIGTVLIITLNDALAMPGRHIIVGDFNLYYPL